MGKKNTRLKIAEALSFVKKVDTELGGTTYVLHDALSKRTRKTIANLYFNLKEISYEKFMQDVGKDLIRLGILPKDYTVYTQFESMSFMASSAPLIKDVKQRVANIDLGDDKLENPFEDGIPYQIYPYVKIWWEEE